MRDTWEFQNAGLCKKEHRLKEKITGLYGLRKLFILCIILNTSELAEKYSTY